VGLTALAPLISLTSLVLWGCSAITDAGLAALAPLTSLASLDLSYCSAITDVGVAAFSQLTVDRCDIAR
jgi:hypothetical protein